MRRPLSLNRYTFSSISLITLVFLIAIVPILQNKGVITWDSFGYYYYLRLAFIDHSMIIHGLDSLRPIFEKYEPSTTLYQFTRVDTGNFIIRYPVGQALIYLPFFIVAHLSALFSHFPADGFSKPYQVVMALGGMIYNIFGFIFTAKILSKHFNDKVVATTLVLILFGTNTYAIIAGGALLAQGSLFFLIALFIWLVDSYFRTKNPKKMLWCGIVFGLICLTRPTDSIIILPAVLWPLTISGLSLKSELRSLFSSIKTLSLFLVPVILCAFIQISYWKFAGGSWIIDSYGNPAEGFDFLRPHTIPFLFSFRSGWLLYTPLMGMVLGLLIFMSIKRDKAMQIILIYTLLYIYIASSWTNWWYGGSFSQRPMVEAYVLLSIPLAFLVDYAFFRKGKLSLPVSILTLGFLCLSIWQTIQSESGVIPGETNTASYYFASFTDLKPDSSKIHLQSFNRAGIYIQPDYGLPEGFIRTKSMEIEIPPSDQCLENKEFLPQLFRISYQDLSNQDFCFILIRAVFEGLPPKNAGIVTAFDHNGNYGYQFRNARENISDSNLTKNQYTSTAVYLTPHLRRSSDVFSGYLWNREKEPGNLIRLQLEVYEKSENE